MDKSTGERLSALEVTIIGKGGIVDRLTHLDECVDQLKRTVWQASGAITIVWVVIQLLLRR